MFLLNQERDCFVNEICNGQYCVMPSTITNHPTVHQREEVEGNASSSSDIFVLSFILCFSSEDLSDH